MDEQKEKLNWKRLLITLGLVIVTAVVIGSSVWYIMDSNMKKERIASDKSVQELRKTIRDLSETKKSAKLTTDVTADSKTYKNAEYGFQMPLTNNWENYTVVNSTDKYLYGATAVYTFGLPSTDKSDSNMPSGFYGLFSLILYTKSQWAELQASDGPKPTIVKENDKYVIGYSHYQIAPADASNNADNYWFKANNDISSMLDSLKFN